MLLVSHSLERWLVPCERGKNVWMVYTIWDLTGQCNCRRWLKMHLLWKGARIRLSSLATELNQVNTEVSNLIRMSRFQWKPIDLEIVPSGGYYFQVCTSSGRSPVCLWCCLANQRWEYGLCCCLCWAVLSRAAGAICRIFSVAGTSELSLLSFWHWSNYFVSPHLLHGLARTQL